MEEWPCWMPCILVEGYTSSPVDTRVKTEMEEGSTFRVIFNTDINVVNGSLILDPDQARWFESFEHKTLAQGSKLFSVPLWIAGEHGVYAARFKERPTLTNKYACWTKYSFALEIEARDLLCEQHIEAMLSMGPDEMRYYYKYFNRLLNYTMPGITNIPGDVYYPPRGQ